jgi:hypothetical protein
LDVLRGMPTTFRPCAPISRPVSAVDSISNQFGAYGSQFSTASVRNQFSPFGSQFSTDTACNAFASNPPQVFNSNRTVYFGELTLNQFRSDAIKIPAVMSWLQTNICRH